jgi:hypothetical protein
MAKRDRKCGSKTRHQTKAGACVEARKAVNVGMNVYRCKQCGCWHIGKTRSPIRSSDRIGALLARHQRWLEKANAGENRD